MKGFRFLLYVSLLYEAGGLLRIQFPSLNLYALVNTEHLPPGSTDINQTMSNPALEWTVEKSYDHPGFAQKVVFQSAIADE